MLTPTPNAKKIQSPVLHIDQPLMLAVCSLLCIGFVMVTSASLHLSAKGLNDIPYKQLQHIILGLITAGFIAQINMKTLEKWSQFLFFGGLILLFVVLIPHVGVTVNGSTRWIKILSLRIQVSEVVKLLSVIYIAGYITRRSNHVRNSAIALFRPLLLFSLASILLLLEPDFGSVVVLIIILMSMMFLGGARLQQFIWLSSVVIGLGYLLIVKSPYRKARLMSFSNPWDDPQNSDFQLSQALIAFGRGEFSGVGLGNGLQKLFYLPEAHTDFLFSVLSEELGLVGAVTVIILFTVFSLRAFWIGDQAEKVGERFSSLVAYGLGIWFGFQAFVNMGVNMGMLPTKGLTLPLMSYGGGSMIVMCSAIAVLFRIHYEVIEHHKSHKERS